MRRRIYTYVDEINNEDEVNPALIHFLRLIPDRLKNTQLSRTMHAFVLRVMRGKTCKRAKRDMAAWGSAHLRSSVADEYQLCFPARFDESLLLGTPIHPHTHSSAWKRWPSRQRSPTVG